MYNIDFKIPCWYQEGCTLKHQSCQRTCHRYLEMNYLINNCGMSNAYRYLKTLSPYDSEVQAYLKLQQIKNNIVSFVNNGQNLYIHSDYLQTGKTSWALKILYKYFDEIWSGNGFRIRGYFLYVPEFLSNLRNLEYKNSPEYKLITNILRTADLVIWDDITANALSQQEQSVLNLFIDRRFIEEKANIFTGLQTKHMDLESLLGFKLANRITTNCVDIHLKGASRKKEI